MVLHPAEHAEAFDDIVGHEVGGGVAGATVMGVVVVPAVLDVRGERGRHAPGALAVAPDEVRDMVADHAAEPAKLIALVRNVVADVGGSGHAGRD